MVFEPINVINNIPSRRTQSITSRPITESGLKVFNLWIKSQDWKINKETLDINDKVEILHKNVFEHVQQSFPLKTFKVTTDDSPWVNNKVKNLKRLKCCELNQHRSSIKWTNLKEQYEKALKDAKNKY